MMLIIIFKFVNVHTNLQILNIFSYNFYKYRLKHKKYTHKTANSILLYLFSDNNFQTNFDLIILIFFF